MTTCRKFHVSGKVQGVFFRDSTRKKAVSLDLTGYAINLDDGRVEVLACGAEQALAELESWLREGPGSADVSQVERSEENIDSPPDSFSTG
ncbi:MAG TPA: acylphosphatase [Wenzhouxiangellaceae bacterium]|nr:acylphosphatase [Wenzhouxiangellaceae bacterium]